MTADWYDLGQRLRAATTGRAVPHLHHAPVVPVALPVAVRAQRQGDQIIVTASTPQHRHGTATGTAALDLLGTLGVTVAASQPVTLVTDTADTVALLHRLAFTATPGSDLDAVAAHIAWWRDRSDFPAGRAVVDTTTACRARWVCGTTPEAEHDPATWRRWLGLSDDTTHGLLAVHARVAAGTPLPFLDVLAESDEWYYSAAQRQHSDGMDWRRADTRYRAALGLRDRCDAADLYAAALLTDPLHRLRAVHTGNVVTGTAHPLNDRLHRVEVTCQRMDARLRPGTGLTGWAGGPATTGPRFSASLASATVKAHRLVITLTGTSGNMPDDGQPVTLIPAPPSPARQRASRRKYRDLYLSRRSWLTTGRTPTPTRRPVPLDVLIAGAEPD